MVPLALDVQGVFRSLVRQQAVFEMSAGPVIITWKFRISDFPPAMGFQLNSSKPLCELFVAINPVMS